jgi:nanoRNase/pAp phosphatase (c-di-AMP/oligoRNAs hydrolase)
VTTVKSRTREKEAEPATRANGGPAPLLPLLPQPASRRALLARFGDGLGKRFTRNNLEILTQAHAAYTGLRRHAKAVRGRGANIFTQWVGDPDALGSAVALKVILEKLGAAEVRILTGSLGHPQNRNLVERCGITLFDPNTERLPRGLHCVVDTSPPLGLSNTGRVEPVRDYFFVADHHTDREEVEERCRQKHVRRVRLGFVGLPVGSTSAFMSALALAFDALDDLGPQGRAAAALGIYTDTSALLHGATALDFRMFEKLTRDEATRDIVTELRAYRVPPEWIEYRTVAFSHMETTGAVRIAPVGYIRADHRDVIAEVASELLRIEGTSIGIAIGVTEKVTEFSVRADSRLLQDDPERIIRVIDYLLGYAFPGVSGFKYERRPPHRVEGGASVPHGEAVQRLWALGRGRNGQAVERKANGSSESLLAHCRDCARALIAALQDLKFARPEEIRGLI